MEKIKHYLLALLALASGVFYALFRGQQRKTAEVETALAKSQFKNVTQENDREYNEAKIAADDLIAEYKRSRTTNKPDGGSAQ